MKVYLAKVIDLDGRHTMSYVYRSMKEAEQDIIAELRRVATFKEEWHYIWITHDDYKAYGMLGDYEVGIYEIDLGEADE